MPFMAIASFTGSWAYDQEKALRTLCPEQSLLAHTVEQLMVWGLGSRTEQPWMVTQPQVLAVSLGSCVTLSKQLYLSGSHVPYVQSRVTGPVWPMSSGITVSRESKTPEHNHCHH